MVSHGPEAGRPHQTTGGAAGLHASIDNVFDQYPDRVPDNRGVPGGIANLKPTNALGYSRYSPYGFSGCFVYARRWFNWCREGDPRFDRHYLTDLALTVNSMRQPPMETTGVWPYRQTVGTTYRIPKLTSRREFFRLPYPITSGATLSVDGAGYKVGEISERGLRVVSGVGRFPLGARIQGVLTLAVGLSCQVSGTVMRIEDDSFVVQLERGPSSFDVIREQRFVARTFPDWKPQPE